MLNEASLFGFTSERAELRCTLSPAPQGGGGGGGGISTVIFTLQQNLQSRARRRLEGGG